MPLPVWIALLGVLPSASPGSAPFDTQKPQKEELRDARRWAQERFAGKAPALPFSFVYGGRSSAELLGAWRRTVARARELDGVTRRTDRWTDPQTGLEVRCVWAVYADYPAVEWTLYLKNAGHSDTPLIERLQGVDAPFQTLRAGDFVLHGIQGDYCAADSYAPYRIPLASGAVERFAPSGFGKSCDGPRGWPYFNLQTPGGGVILAVGWPGQWAAAFTRTGDREVRVAAGQETTRLILKPGEEVRTPLIALLFWRGDDPVRAQNLWRRWYMAHNLPRVGGKPQPPIAQIQVDGGMNTLAGVQAFLDAGIRPDICWRDAGGSATWYPSADGPFRGNDSWLNTGTWEVDPKRYPQGFKPFSDWAHARGMQFLLWLEPERVGSPSSWLARNHPEWLLPGTPETVGDILNLGNPAAREWLTDHVDALIKSQGLDWYREDMNGNGPRPAWRKADAPDRQGITENLYVQGHLAFWDALRRRNPGLHIDSCASGGRRNDLETMRRAVPLLRSDFQWPDMPDLIAGNQGHTYGLSSWLPYQGTGCYLYDSYSLRSFYLASFGMGGLSSENRKAQRTAYEECARIAPSLLGDYYPLTPYSRGADRWIAWQFDRPGAGEGVVQAFRRPKCAEESLTVRLRGLDPAAQYEVTDFDAPEKQERTGRELVETGLAVSRKERPAAVILMYRRKQGPLPPASLP